MYLLDEPAFTYFLGQVVRVTSGSTSCYTLQTGKSDKRGLRARNRLFGPFQRGLVQANSAGPTVRRGHPSS